MPLRSSEYARERDARVCSLLDTHPVTAAMLVALGWFPSRNKAYGRLRRLLRKRRVLLVGAVGASGGPEKVYCRWRPKADQLRHELDLTRVCLQLSASRIHRGPAVNDLAISPDAEVWINGHVFYLELDRGTMRLKQIERRFARYEACPHFSLWVCADEKRKEELRCRAGNLRTTALFTTFAQALADPHAAIWTDFGGDIAALPRQR